MSRNLGALTLLDPSGPAWTVMGVNGSERTKNGKLCGPEGVHVEMLKHGTDKLISDVFFTEASSVTLRN
jgi:hypothetical protein